MLSSWRKYSVLRPSTPETYLTQPAGVPRFLKFRRNQTEALALLQRGRPGDCVPPEYDAGYWRRLAEDARSTAEKMTDAEARRRLQFVATAYERLAEHAEQTVGRRRAAQKLI
jgi:hypothetical protein